MECGSEARLLAKPQECAETKASGSAARLAQDGKDHAGQEARLRGKVVRILLVGRGKPAVHPPTAGRTAAGDAGKALRDRRDTVRARLAGGAQAALRSRRRPQVPRNWKRVPRTRQALARNPRRQGADAHAQNTRARRVRALHPQKTRRLHSRIPARRRLPRDSWREGRGLQEHLHTGRGPPAVRLKRPAHGVPRQEPRVRLANTKARRRKRRLGHTAQQPRENPVNQPRDARLVLPRARKRPARAHGIQQHAVPREAGTLGQKGVYRRQRDTRNAQPGGNDRRARRKRLGAPPPATVVPQEPRRDRLHTPRREARDRTEVPEQRHGARRAAAKALPAGEPRIPRRARHEKREE